MHAVTAYRFAGRTDDSHRTGVLIIRAWIEEGSSEPLRARVRLTTDVSAGVERTLTLVRHEEVCAAVEDWLADFLVSAKLPD